TRKTWGRARDKAAFLVNSAAFAGTPLSSHARHGLCTITTLARLRRGPPFNQLAFRISCGGRRKGGVMFPIRTILFATVFSPCSEYAFQLASGLAHDYQSRLLITHVHELPTAAYGEFGALPPAEEEADAARARLLALKPSEATIKVEYLLAEGDP